MEKEPELEPLNNVENGTASVKDKLPEDLEFKTSSKRDTWSNRVEFLLAIIGFTVGIGSIWRFPILCARNGGGAFLIPFFFFLLTCGGPLYYIEVCLGQFSGKSAAAAFEFCPLFKGTEKFLEILFRYLVTVPVKYIAITCAISFESLIFVFFSLSLSLVVHTGGQKYVTLINFL